MQRIIALLIVLFVSWSGVALSADKLIIISPHRKSLQQEFIPAFKTHYKQTYKQEIDVEWLDQGGTSDDIRFVRSKFARNPKSSGIDLFWGGGSATFIDLANDGVLSSYKLSDELTKKIPAEIAGIPMYDSKKNFWYGSALSSFGVFYNKKLVKIEKLAEPTTWGSLAHPSYFGQVTLTDPRRSGSSNTMNTIILQSLGWDKGWELLTSIAGNTRQFTHSSSDPIKAVVSGDTVAAMAIDFYAAAKISDLGANNLGFILPEGQTVLDPDPVAILKGAPNRKAAERFIEFVLSTPAQRLLVQKKGSAGGPKQYTLGRMSPNREVYEKAGSHLITANPFMVKQTLSMDGEKAAKLKAIFNDLIGATLVDTHSELKKAWQIYIKKGAKPEHLKKLTKPLATEAEILKLAEQWDNNVLRNKTINDWVKQARARYTSSGNMGD